MEFLSFHWAHNAGLCSERTPYLKGAHPFRIERDAKPDPVTLSECQAIASIQERLKAMYLTPARRKHRFVSGMKSNEEN